MLVVVVIIGILAGFISLSISNRALDDRMEVEARRLAEIFRLAQEEAEFKSVEIGFATTPEGYQFLSRDDAGEWHPYREAGPLRPRTFEEPLHIELWVEGRSPPVQKKLKPPVLFLSSGEVTAFSARILATDHPAAFRIEVDPLGKLAMTRESPAR